MPLAKSNESKVLAADDRNNIGTHANAQDIVNQGESSSGKTKTTKTTKLVNVPKQQSSPETPTSVSQESQPEKSGHVARDVEHIPFVVQHMVYTKLQTVLEQICYHLSLGAAPQILNKRSWTCPEALELHVWVGMVKDMKAQSTGASSSRLDWLDEGLLKSLVAIRHAAVHREQLPIATIENHVAAAEKFAKAFGDYSHQTTITGLKQVMSSAMDNRMMYQVRAATIREQYERDRAEVNLERDARLKELHHEQQNRQELLDKEFKDLVQLRATPSTYHRILALLSVVVPSAIMKAFRTSGCD